uniref:At1g61320/AtMIF1 LRR domain-containing protein n=1 Tax=Chenopodium quinoa TaxID=63459 RepID=A0A803LJ08_CHEQI
MPSFRLPNLKLLHLRAALISNDYFVTRLLSSCPLLEDLTVEACWDCVHTTSISSPSLRRLCIRKHELDIYENSAFVSIHTPNLEYFEYYDNLALQYSIPNMDWLVKADINIGNDLLEEEFEESCWQMLNFIRPLSNVQHLSLTGSCTEDLDVHGVEDQLPVFPNLKHLELGYSGYNYWDKVSLAFLNRSPLLETLIFPQGITTSFEQEALDEFNMQSLMMEGEFFRTILANAPWCCRSYLKRIVIKTYSGTDREVNLIQFLLRHASVLEELILF